MIVLYADVLILLFATAICQNIQVTIRDGILQGSMMTDYDGGQFYKFTRIPFAKPPLGKYRFRLSEKNDPWKGIRDATQASPKCSQPNSANAAEVGQEDCLYLNVYTKSTSKYALQPVMIYIHGGKLLQGSSAEYGAEFLMTEDIVLVTINYRLGVYGFINTVNSDIATDADMFGNNGFKDQVLAMKWVQRNIQCFGGNPKKVTISGESAGGMSVHAHVLSPLSTGLFHQAIAMSGSALLVVMQTANDTATPLANYLGLNTTNYNAMMEGLRRASNEDLFNAIKALKWLEVQLNQPCLTALVIEKPGAKNFISDYPLKTLKSGKYNHVPLMIGNNNREGLFIYASREDQPNLENLTTHIPFYFHDRNEVMDKVRAFYNLDSIDGPWDLIDFYTDIWIRYHTLRTAREHATIQSNEIYCYQFSGDGKLNYLKTRFPSIMNLYGACHADELGYLFETVGSPTAGSLEEKLMRTIVETWSNFVIFGKPVKNLDTFQAHDPHYVNITNNGLKFGLFIEKSFKFWDNIYKKYSDGLY